MLLRKVYRTLCQSLIVYNWPLKLDRLMFGRDIRLNLWRVLILFRTALSMWIKLERIVRHFLIYLVRIFIGTIKWDKRQLMLLFNFDRLVFRGAFLFLYHKVRLLNLGEFAIPNAQGVLRKSVEIPGNVRVSTII